jgi:hypothetical protein
MPCQKKKKSENGDEINTFSKTLKDDIENFFPTDQNHEKC